MPSPARDNLPAALGVEDAQADRLDAVAGEGEHKGVADFVDEVARQAQEMPQSSAVGMLTAANDAEPGDEERPGK